MPPLREMESYVFDQMVRYLWRCLIEVRLKLLVGCEHAPLKPVRGLYSPETTRTKLSHRNIIRTPHDFAIAPRRGAAGAAFGSQPSAFRRAHKLHTRTSLMNKNILTAPLHFAAGPGRRAAGAAAGAEPGAGRRAWAARPAAQQLWQRHLHPKGRQAFAGGAVCAALAGLSGGE